ncbi:MAG TPA: glycosyltransferase family 2 protein [Opitutus sp.]|nr:glycosyltransferase family 2 protein [Opitutus sp.]
MPNAPLLSIVIVAYKSRDEIGACLASLPRELALADGTRGTVEVVVVDNSPGEGAGEIVRGKFPWVRYVPAETNLGFGRANNLGFAMADAAGECVLFLNPDTIANAAALAQCAARLRGDETIGLISPRLVLADGTMDLACRRSIPTLWDGFCRASGLAAAWPRTRLFAGYNLTHWADGGTYDVGAINGAFMMGRRAVLEQVAARTADRRAAVFDEEFFMYGDDLDLCIRVARAGRRIVYDGSVSITHLKGVSVAKDFAAMSVAIFDANRDVFLKHFGGSAFARWKWRAAFGVWKRVALWRAKAGGRRSVRPV